MASINTRRDKNGNLTFLIRVYRGYDSSGKRLKPYTLTYTPEPGWSEKGRYEKQTSELCSLSRNVRTVLQATQLGLK